jgi:hypothetical protein
MMNWAWGYDDRENLHSSLLYRYVISYEPHNFRGHLQDFPDTLAYGKKIDALRKRHAALLWDATFRDTLGAEVTVGQEPHALYSVFEATDGTKTVVIANHGDQPIAASVSVGGHKGPFQVATPEAPEPVQSKGIVEVPARSAVIVIAGSSSKPH